MEQLQELQSPAYPLLVHHEVTMENIFIINQKAKTNRHYYTATIGTYNSTNNTATLVFPGETTESSKSYKVNPSVSFSSGDRVVLIKEAGTYYVVSKK